MVEIWMIYPGERSPATKPAMIETQTESWRHRAWMTLMFRRGKAELMAHGTEVEMGIRKTTLEPEERRSPVELKGWKAEVQPAASNPEVEPGWHLTKATPEGRGSLVELVG